MASSDEFEISRSSTFRSRRALLAASCAGVGGGLLASGGLYGDSVGLVIAMASEGGIIFVGLGNVAIEVGLVNCGNPGSGEFMSLLRRCL